MALLRCAPLWLLVVGACHVVFDGEVGTVRCAEEGGYGPPACPEGHTCMGGICADVGAPLGAPCGADSACRPPFHCLDPASVGRDGARRCSTTCCASSDCGPPGDGRVCFDPPGGTGAFCWSAAELGRAAPGALGGGEDCGSDDECRSGRCDGGTCEDVCCTDASCTAGRTCRISNVEGEDRWTCGPSSTGADERYCQDHAECRSGRCEAIEGLVERLCLEPCCASRECGSIEIAGERKLLACAAEPTAARACRRLLPSTADGAVGHPCETDAECRSGLCVPDEEGRFCSDLCCRDDDCGNLAQYACRPASSGNVWTLRCVRK